MDIERIGDTNSTQCCERHFLVNSQISVQNDDEITYINFKDLSAGIELNQLRTIFRHKDHLIATLERENTFLREQVRCLNVNLDQLAIINKTAARNDIRIRVENSAGVSIRKWYRNPKVMLSGGGIVVLFSIWLRYKIKNW